MVEENTTVATTEEEQVILLAHGETGDALLLHLVEEMDCAETLRVPVFVHIRNVPHFECCVEWGVCRIGLDRGGKQKILQYPRVTIVLSELLAELVGNSLRLRDHEIGTTIDAVANGV